MKKILPIFLLFLTFFLAGCTSSTPDVMELTRTFESAVETAIVETIAASANQNEKSPDPTSKASEIPSIDSIPSATSELISTNTLMPIPPTPTTIPTPCYRAELVEETVPDGTKFSAGEWFGKVWIVKNTGVCEWTADFRWVLVDGEDFSGVTNVTINRSVMPGEDLRVLLELKAPLVPGFYKGTYQILTEEGGSVTPSGFWVLIEVK